mgnify:CR=1 FL=1
MSTCNEFLGIVCKFKTETEGSDHLKVHLQKPFMFDSFVYCYYNDYTCAADEISNCAYFVCSLGFFYH